MSTRVTVRITDNNRIPQLIKELQSLDKFKIQLGIVAPSGDKLYMVAWVHEFGIDIPVTEKMRGWFLAQGMPLKKGITKITIPERSYFRTGFDENKSAIQRKCVELINQVLAGKKTARQAREEIGEFAAKKIQSKVEDVKLVDTGALRDAIGFRVKFRKKKR